MSKALVIVESPAKAKTIKKYLGNDFTVKASVGHVKDLPKSKMGVDVEKNFEPEYELIRGKSKVMAEIRKSAKEVDIIYLAPDPDREGEAIAWHIAEELGALPPGAGGAAPTNGHAEAAADDEADADEDDGEAAEAEPAPTKTKSGHVVTYGAKATKKPPKAEAKTAKGKKAASAKKTEKAAPPKKVVRRSLKKGQQVYRVLFNEITKKGVTEALKHPTVLNQQKFESQQARRILDRLVGYEVSPLLWRKVKRGLSAGRVQSVAVRLIVEREREIARFIATEYWTVDADFSQARLPKETAPVFGARLLKIDGKKAEIATGDDARRIAGELQAEGTTFQVTQVEKKERRRFPMPPFITSRLQQEAARRLHYTAKKTMGLAQKLYEGIELGAEGAVGLITYMRTDSVRLSPEAVQEARGYIAKRYGATALPDEPNVYKSRKQAQDAHEAIRPTSMDYDPETVRRMLGGGNGELDRDTEELVRLYTLIWNRYIACQMKPAVYDQTAVDIAATPATAPAGDGAPYLFRANGQVLKFPGFTAVYSDAPASDPSEKEKEESPEGGAGPDAAAAEAQPAEGSLPDLAQGDDLRRHAIKPEQHFTQPPPRFTEASLVKELEEQGIGRPSTYANIMSTIQDREYVEKREGRFFPTELGTLVTGLLVESFPDIFNVDFTAQMEERLDQVEEGNVNWVALLQGFYGPFQVDLKNAIAHMRDVKREEIPTEHMCEKCGNPLVIKWGRNGSFLACSGYPECRNTKEYERGANGEIKVLEGKTTDEICETCSSPMVYRRGRFGEFLACSRYPECKTTKPISLGIDCPKPGCGGFLTEKRSKRGRSFYGCSNYSKTQCDFVIWDRPVPEPCPMCATPFLVKKETRRAGLKLRCVNKDCGYTRSEGGEADAPDDAAAASEAT
jgi:DNA topoisomerase-1